MAEIFGEVNPETLNESQRIETALDLAMQYGGIDGNHHKAWAIDQIVRVLTGCPVVQVDAVDVRGTQYTDSDLGESESYQRFVAEHNAGEDGADTYEWDIGIAP